MNLEEIRTKIDTVDQELLDLFETRLALSRQVAEYKRNNSLPVYDAVREQEKLGRIQAMCKSPGDSPYAADLFAHIMGLSRKLQYGVLGEKTQDSGLFLWGGFQLPGRGEALRCAYEHGLSGDLNALYTAIMLAYHEDPFSLACEKRGDAGASLNSVALHDISLIRSMLRERASGSMEFIHPKPEEGCLSEGVRNGIESLAESLLHGSTDEEALKSLSEFYLRFGAGIPGMHRAFRLSEDGKTGDCLVPIQAFPRTCFDDLVGLQSQKERLMENTDAFLSGKKANNVLLYGDAGTGKSTCIKALANEYYDRGLRVIEVYRHQYRLLPPLIEGLRRRNYHFVLYLDDLSFEEFETEYKYLKAVIEGGLSERPGNVLIYATSNRRHLIRESFKDRQERDEDLHSNDTVQEKLSLSGRFGISIYFGRPDKKEYNEIVKRLAGSEELSLSEELLLAEANKWELTHGGRSGRAARQFVDYLSGIHD